MPKLGIHRSNELRSLNSLKQERQNPIEKMKSKTKDAAKMYEKLFLRDMVKAMRKTVPKGGMLPANIAEKIFSEKLDGEYVESWGERGGIGLADLIYKQIMDRFGPQMGVGGGAIRSMGPFPLKGAKPHSVKAIPSDNRLSFEIKSKHQEEGRVLVTPWSGILTQKTVLEDGRLLAEVRHDNGLVSKFVTRGQSTLGVGESLSEGQPIGQLLPVSEGLTWQVQPLVERRNVEKTVSL